MLQSSYMNLFVLHSVTRSVIQSITIFCLHYVLQNNGLRTYIAKYETFVCFKPPLRTCLFFTQSLSRLVSSPHFIQNNVHRTCLTTQKCLYATKHFYRPICPSISRYLSQSVTNDFLSALYHPKWCSFFINFMCLTSSWSNYFHSICGIQLKSFAPMDSLSLFE